MKRRDSASGVARRRGKGAVVGTVEVPLLRHIACAVGRRVKSHGHAWVSPLGSSREFQDGSMPASLANAFQKPGSDGQGPMNVLMHTLFALVALLLIADLHSSYLASNAQWETNPFMTVLAERTGSRAALVAIKSLDFMCLAGVYVLWRRSRAHIVIAVALSTTAFVYVDIVLNNYSS